MNWNWACEQLLKGKKVRTSRFISDQYFSIIDGQVMTCEIAPIILDKDYITATDWELYEPKKWTEDDIRKAKAGIELGFEWVTRDKTDEIFFFVDKPSKLGEFWEYAIYDKRISINTNLFSCVRWEDEEPTRLQDIADSEVEE